MKVNQFGTLAIIGVVVSLTVACNGSPTKPTAISSPPGDGASVSSVNLSNAMPVSAQTCTTQWPTFDEYSYQNDNVQNVGTSIVTCDVSAAADQTQAQEEVVVSEVSSMDSARFVHRLHR
jgi:hypothetical protein